MSAELIVYLVTHATVTIGGLVIFFLRIEHRLTKVETKVESLEKKVGTGCPTSYASLEK